MFYFFRKNMTTSNTTSNLPKTCPLISNYFSSHSNNFVVRDKNKDPYFILTGYYTTENPDFTKISNLPKYRKAIVTNAFLAKRGNGLNGTIHNKDHWPTGHRGSAPIHYQLMHEGAQRKHAAEQVLSDLDKHENFTNYYDKALDKIINQLEQKNINIPDEGLTIWLAYPSRNPHKISATQNYLTYTFKDKIKEELNQRAKDKKIAIRFEDTILEAIQVTSRTDADSTGRIVQQGLLHAGGIEKNDLVVFVDDHIENGDAALNSKQAIEDQGGICLGICAISSTPMGRTLELDTQLANTFRTIIEKKYTKEDIDTIEKALNLVGLSIDTLTNISCLSILAMLIDKEDTDFKNQILAIYHRLHLDDNHKTIETWIDSANNSILSLIEEKALSPNEFFTKIESNKESQRYTVPPFTPEKVLILDFDETLHTESKKIYDDLLSTLKTIFKETAVKIEDIFQDYPSFEKDFSIKLGTSKIKCIKFLLNHSLIFEQVVSLIAKETHNQRKNNFKDSTLIIQEIKEKHNALIKDGQDYTQSPIYQKLRSIFDSFYKNESENLSLIPGTVKTLQSAWKSSNLLIIVSNRGQEKLNSLVKKLEQEANVRFDAVIGDSKKPKITTTVHALKTLGFNLPSLAGANTPIIVVGDRKTDMQLAENLAANLNSQGFTNPNVSCILLDRFGGLFNNLSSNVPIKIVTSLESELLHVN